MDNNKVNRNKKFNNFSLNPFTVTGMASWQQSATIWMEIYKEFAAR